MRKFITILLLAAAVTAVTLFYHKDKSGKGPSFLLANVERGPIIRTVTSSGTLNAVITVKVGSQVSGLIKELLVDFNSKVREGQVIARINPESFEARVRQGEAELAVSQANVEIQRAALERSRAELENMRAALTAARANTEKATTAFEDASRELGRRQRLYKRGIVSQSEMDKTQAVYDQAQAQLSAARAEQQAQAYVVRSRKAAIRMAKGQLAYALAQVKQREATLRQSRIDLEHTIIRSPVDGVVIERNVDTGQTVAASLQAPTLFTIARDMRKMQVDTDMDEADIGHIRVGQQATFTVDTFPGREFSGRVNQIRKAPHTVQNVVTYTVVVSADNSDLSLLPGMTANVKIVVDERPDALRVPNAALRFRPAGSGKGSGGSGGAGAMARGAAGGSAERINRLIKALSLNSDQESHVRGMYSEARNKVADMRRKGASREDIRAEIERMRERMREAISAILTQEQREKLDRLLKAREYHLATPGRVWVMGQDGKASPVEVMTGISDGSFSEIVRGDLKAGQQVIVGVNQATRRSSPKKKRFGF